jgi:ATPase
VMPDDASVLIGKGGRTIRELEQELGVHLDVKAERAPSGGARPGEAVEDFDVRDTKNNLVLYVDPGAKGRMGVVEVDGRRLGTTRVGRKGDMRFAKRSNAGRAIMEALEAGDDLVIRL